MESSKFKTVIMTFVPLLVAIALQVAVNFIDIIIVFIGNIMSKETHLQGEEPVDLLNRALDQPMNRAFVMLAMHLVILVVFGYWYSKEFKEGARVKDRARQGFLALGVKRLPFILLCGICGQVFVDAALLLVRRVGPDLFENYDKMINDVVGVSASWASLLATFLIAPVAEELLFRGVTLGFARRFLSPVPAVLLQAVLFGLFHGNVIQFCYAFLLGSALGALAVRYDNLLPGMLLHICINLSLLIIPDISRLSIVPLVGLFVGPLCLFLLGMIFLMRPESEPEEEPKKELKKEKNEKSGKKQEKKTEKSAEDTKEEPNKKLDKADSKKRTKK